uniref:Alpha-ketoglutarate-dependent dioxygenase FTO n=1 Tax=Laticauda laticaudata TaxID=8630 RepID=A0A8C5SXI8_LATLA
QSSCIFKENNWDNFKTKYSKVILKNSEKIPQDLHEEVQEAFFTLRKHVCFFQDLVRIKGRGFVTPVSRILIGNPGCYDIHYSNPEISLACIALSRLNDYLQRESLLGLQEQDLAETTGPQNSPFGDGDQDYITETGAILQDQNPSLKSDSTILKERTSYNLTLLNYMDPQKMPSLKLEPYFGMGRMAVSWHKSNGKVNSGVDGGILEEKSAAGRDPDVWHVGLKVAWDIETPGLAIPLHQGDCYFMLVNSQSFFTQTFFLFVCKFQQCSTGTLPYILDKCKAALENLNTDADLKGPSLKSVEVGDITRVEKTHSEVEFEWLRQQMELMNILSNLVHSLYNSFRGEHLLSRLCNRQREHRKHLSSRPLSFIFSRRYLSIRPCCQQKAFRWTSTYSSSKLGEPQKKMIYNLSSAL